MSKDSKFYLSSFLTILISVTIITLLWNNISLPYKNSAEVIGVYSNNNHHHLNDTIRFIIFISIPLFVFILNCFFLHCFGWNYFGVLDRQECRERVFVCIVLAGVR